MKRSLIAVAGLAVASMASGCGDTVNSLLDGFLGGNPDMTTPPDLYTYPLHEGVWKVSGPVTMINDGCMVNPNDPMNPTAGQIWALVNEGDGKIKIGNPTDPGNPNNPQMYDAKESGDPPQPALGAACPPTNPPAQCATEPSAKPFSDNAGTLVRDNNVTVAGTMMCTFHRHIVNQVVITADGKFTAQYSRKDTNKMNCLTNKNDCTTTWSWEFERVKDFGK